ncbi:hypothetical protein O181_042271, partial [Austropuccinia psidii MF-1]|nr:hypothetical protein [Austropuccinia psidii MF-1]
MPSIVKSSNMDNVMNIYEAPDPNLFVDLNCQRLRNDPNVNIITESSQIQDPNSFNAFLQSFFHNSNHIFQPQPIWATPHHHYLLQQHHLINSNDFNETSDDNFLVGNTSLQSPSDFSLDDNSPTADLSFGLVPFGTLSSLQNQSTPTDSLAIHSNNYSHAPLYYYTTSQSATLDPAHISTTLIGYPSEREPELNPISPLNETNMLSNYSLGQDQNDSGHFFISSNQLVPPSLGNFHPSPQLHQVESSLSSCPLVEIPPTAHQTLPFSPIRSGKRLRSPTLTSENTVDPNNSNYLQQSPTAYHPTLDELKFPSNSQPLLEQSLLACNLPPCPEQDTSQLKIKSSK